MAWFIIFLSQLISSFMLTMFVFHGFFPSYIPFIMVQRQKKIQGR